MKRQTLINLCLLAAGGLFLLCTCKSHTSTGGSDSGSAMYSSTRLPQDAMPVCTISTDSFNTWFESGQASQDGTVTPASSVGFVHNFNCDFYQWSERMFLWVTSPATGQYGSGGRILESPVFYTVVGDGIDSSRLIRNQPGTPINAVSALRKNGPNRLPVFSDGKGHLYEVQFHKPGEKILLKTRSGQLIELGSVQKAATGQALLKDKVGKAIPDAEFVNNFEHPERVLHAFKTPAGIVFLNFRARQVDTYLNQATGDALMAQDGSLVYYITMVNDMYAYYLTAVNDHNALSRLKFPTDTLTMDSILAYANKRGFPSPPDSGALCIEIKSSWVIANDSLVNADPSNFITIKAIVPTYKKIDDRLWLPVGERPVTLMLTGIHIVGGVSGHPEMIWSTFEKANNTPNAAYQYLDNTGQVQTVPADTGKWLFSNAQGAPFNMSHIRADDSLSPYLLRADSPFIISASNTQRSAPFGVAYTGQPNNQDLTPAASNSEIIGINNAVINNIPGNDPRKRYHFIGATWTFGGAPPNGNVYPVDQTPGTAIGTSILANSTMETYLQTNSTSCFSCHNDHNSLSPDSISHIFTTLKPLVPRQNPSK